LAFVPDAGKRRSSQRYGVQGLHFRRPWEPRGRESPGKPGRQHLQPRGRSRFS
jgi:hypothetical protein